MKPFLSIITINYNDAVGLEKTIQSVISQSYKDVEYLVIDGASTDSSATVINKFADKIDCWVTEKDTGIYNAMNKGIKAAKGDYLLFLNSGDLLNGSTALMDFIHHPDFQGDIIYGDYKFDKGGKVYPDTLTPLFFYRSSLPHQSTLFHKKVFEEMGLYDEHFKMVSDRAFYIKCFLSNQFVFKHINYPLAVFDLSGVSNDPSYKKKQVIENEKMFEALYGIYNDDYKHMLLLQHQLNETIKKTIFGIWKRIINKIKTICQIR